MRTARLEIVRASGFSGYRQMCLWGGSSPNEQIWTGFQWSPPGVTSREVGLQFWCLAGGVPLPGDLFHDAFDATSPPPTEGRGQKFIVFLPSEVLLLTVLNEFPAPIVL